MRQIAGLHLIMDGYTCDAERLQPDNVHSMMDELVKALGMEYLQRPSSFLVPTDPRKLSSDADEGGWSTFCQITTSHIALHGWPLRRAFMMDVFSCKPFDVGAAKQLIYEWLDVDRAVCTVLDRAGPASLVPGPVEQV